MVDFGLVHRVGFELVYGVGFGLRHRVGFE